jgi:F-type H+-transporting ATPase subunit epsilon
VTMNVQLVEPEGELWGGRAEMIIARTLDGEIGLLTNHAPIIGILYEGSTVQIRPENGNGADVFAAVTASKHPVLPGAAPRGLRPGQLTG